MIACTVVARNYLPAARVLAASFRAQHPSGDVRVLLLDDVRHEATDEEHLSILRPADIGITDDDYAEMAAMYTVTELATAVKPWLLRRLIADGPAMYLDPDIRVYEPLDDLFELAAEHSVVLTPHTMVPIPRDGLSPDDEDLLKSGSFNLGFLGVGPSSAPFLDWWAERLRWDCLRAPELGLFVDQRWVDLAVHLFPAHVCRDQTLNVAYWNLHGRRFETENGRYLVNGEPLRFFHFSGYSPTAPDQLARYLPRPRLDPSHHPPLRQILDEYGAELMSAGWDGGARSPYAYATTPDGLHLSTPIRRAYRDALMAGIRPPNPFDPSEAAAFRRWAGPMMSHRWLRRLPAPVEQLLRRTRATLGSTAR